MPGPAVPEEVRRLAEERAAARARRDFPAADRLRERIRALGFEPVDRPDGRTDLVPTGGRAERSGPPPHATVVWRSEGWPGDLRRGIASFRAGAGPGRPVQHVVVDATGGEWPEGVEVVRLEEDPGWAGARNAGIRAARGRIVVVADGSVEATGDWLAPLEACLAEPTVGVCGPFGLVTDDLREFREDPGPEVDAIEGYLMALRREVLERAGGFDPWFRFYRMSDVELSFRVKALGLRAVRVDLPVLRHTHRTWEATSPEERERLSRRGFYRFLDRYRDRFELTVRGRREG